MNDKDDKPGERAIRRTIALITFFWLMIFVYSSYPAGSTDTGAYFFASDTDSVTIVIESNSTKLEPGALTPLTNPESALWPETNTAGGISDRPGDELSNGAEERAGESAVERAGGSLGDVSGDSAEDKAGDSSRDESSHSPEDKSGDDSDDNTDLTEDEKGNEADGASIVGGK